MSEHTSFESFDAFLDAGGFEVGEEENLETVVPEEDLDQHVRETTSFDRWEAMREDAAQTWAIEQLGW